MKAFLAALVCFVLLAGVTGFFTIDQFSLSSSEAYSTPSAQVGVDGTPEHRGWN